MSLPTRLAAGSVCPWCDGARLKTEQTGQPWAYLMCSYCWAVFNPNRPGEVRPYNQDWRTL